MRWSNQNKKKTSVQWLVYSSPTFVFGVSVVLRVSCTHFFCLPFYPANLHVTFQRVHFYLTGPQSVWAYTACAFYPCNSHEYNFMRNGFWNQKQPVVGQQRNKKDHRLTHSVQSNNKIRFERFRILQRKNGKEKLANIFFFCFQIEYNHHFIIISNRLYLYFD